MSKQSNLQSTSVAIGLMKYHEYYHAGISKHLYAFYHSGAWIFTFWNTYNFLFIILFPVVLLEHVTEFLKHYRYR